MSIISSDVIERFLHIADMPCPIEYFPWFGEGCQYIDSRMCIYGSYEYWAIVIQEIVVNEMALRHEAVANMFYVWDSKNNAELKYPEILRITSDGDDGEVFSELYLNNNVKTMRIRESIIPIPQSVEVYTRKNIELVDPEKIFRYELMRVLIPEYREAFFLSDNEILKKLDLEIPKLLQLEEWRHPVVNEDTTLEYPGECEVFQLIAEVIENLDPTLYRPTEEPNTHWSNWTTNDYLL